jgi:hypothetical protein
MKRWARCAFRPTASCAVYFTILLAVQAGLGFDRGFGYDAAHAMPFTANVAQIMHGLWPSDFALYIHGAELIPIYRLKTFTGTFGMYPPGLSCIDYAILKLWPGAPLYALLFFAELVLWSMVFTMLASLVHKIFSWQGIAVLLPLGLLIFPFFTNDLLWQATGMTEGVATPLFAIGCIGSLLLLLSPNRHNWLTALAIGLVFAAASYIRAQFDLVISALMIVTIIFLLFQWVAQKNRNLKIHTLTLLLIFIAYQGATIPYKIFKHAPTIVVMDYGWGQVWTQKQDAEKYHVYVGLGMQSICEIEPIKCQEFTDRRNRGEDIDLHEYEHAAIIAVLHHPLALLKFKLPIFWQNWFVDMFEDAPQVGSYRWIADFILALSLPFTCLYSFARDRSIGIAYTLYAGSFVFACMIFSLLIHIEPRYFLPIKLLGAISLLFVLADLGRRYRYAP